MSSTPHDGSDAERGIIVEVRRNKFIVATSSQIVKLYSAKDDNYRIGDCIALYSKVFPPRRGEKMHEHLVTYHKKCPNFVNFETEGENWRQQCKLVCEVTDAMEYYDDETRMWVREFQTDFLDKVIDGRGETKNWRNSKKLVGMRVVCEKVCKGEDYKQDYWIVAKLLPRDESSKITCRVTSVLVKKDDENGGLMRWIRTDSPTSKSVLDWPCHGTAWKYSPESLIDMEIICKRIADKNLERVHWIVDHVIDGKIYNKSHEITNRTVGLIRTISRNRNLYFVLRLNQYHDLTMNVNDMKRLHGDRNFCGKWISFVLDSDGEIDQQSVEIIKDAYPTEIRNLVTYIRLPCSFDPKTWNRVGTPMLKTEFGHKIRDSKGVLERYNRLDGFENEEAWVSHAHPNDSTARFVLGKDQDHWVDRNQKRQTNGTIEKITRSTLVVEVEEKENSSSHGHDDSEERKETEFNESRIDSPARPSEVEHDYSGEGQMDMTDEGKIESTSLVEETKDSSKLEQNNSEQRQENLLTERESEPTLAVEDTKDLSKLEEDHSEKRGATDLNEDFCESAESSLDVVNDNSEERQENSLAEEIVNSTLIVEDTENSSKLEQSHSGQSHENLLAEGKADPTSVVEDTKDSSKLKQDNSEQRDETNLNEDRCESPESSFDVLNDFSGERVYVDVDRDDETESEGSYQKMKRELTGLSSAESDDSTSIDSDDEDESDGIETEDSESEDGLNPHGKLNRRHSESDLFAEVNQPCENKTKSLQDLSSISQ